LLNLPILSKHSQCNSFNFRDLHHPFKMMLSKFSSGLLKKSTSGNLARAVGSRFLQTQSATKTPSAGMDLSSTDNLFQEARDSYDSDATRRAATYMTLGGSRLLYASVGRLAVVKLVASMSASADVLALASMEVDLANIEPGKTATLKWRGKPVFATHRNAAQLAQIKADDELVSTFRDPQLDSERVQNESYTLCTAICTHLGCVPIANAGDFGGYFCPCHGSHYDLSGRIRKGPAPLNLEVPPYKFLTDTKVCIG